MPQKVKNFIKAAEKLGINVEYTLNWDEEGTIKICFTNVLNYEGDETIIMVTPEGKLAEF